MHRAVPADADDDHVIATAVDAEVAMPLQVDRRFDTSSIVDPYLRQSRILTPGAVLERLTLERRRNRCVIEAHYESPMSVRPARRFRHEVQLAAAACRRLDGWFRQRPAGHCRRSWVIDMRAWLRPRFGRSSRPTASEAGGAIVGLARALDHAGRHQQ